MFLKNWLCYFRMEFYQIDQLSGVFHVEEAQVLVLLAFHAR